MLLVIETNTYTVAYARQQISALTEELNHVRLNLSQLEVAVRVFSESVVRASLIFWFATEANHNRGDPS